MAGMMAMDISTQLQLPRAAPRSRPEPYRPKTCQVATRPAQPLAAGLGEIGGLLIVDDGILADGDTVTGKNIVDGKFDILHQQVERPAAAFVQDLL